ncbi:hypothetical protein M378DRAFT_751039 [Amanita muscaria Koide BX008]|uniref:Uncharacterized protein n=1 Tax=Amanita muscaria (strain Koide BX008) TaxID=946122 RepID=A0A0C2X1L6_AMAMK|nr:hypothetical protein M378DRAFT_751039 [Amanita muscaria Koide BX008]
MIVDVHLQLYFLLAERCLTLHLAVTRNTHPQHFLLIHQSSLSIQHSAFSLFFIRRRTLPQNPATSDIILLSSTKW